MGSGAVSYPEHMNHLHADQLFGTSHMLYPDQTPPDPLATTRVPWLTWHDPDTYANGNHPSTDQITTSVQNANIHWRAASTPDSLYPETLSVLERVWAASKLAGAMQSNGETSFYPGESEGGSPYDGFTGWNENDEAVDGKTTTGHLLRIHYVLMEYKEAVRKMDPLANAEAAIEAMVTLLSGTKTLSDWAVGPEETNAAYLEALQTFVDTLPSADLNVHNVLNLEYGRMMSLPGGWQALDPAVEDDLADMQTAVDSVEEKLDNRPANPFLWTEMSRETTRATQVMQFFATPARDSISPLATVLEDFQAAIASLDYGDLLTSAFEDGGAAARASLIDETAIAAQVLAFRGRSEHEHLRNTTRVAAGMFDMRATMTTQFGVAMAQMESGRASDVSSFEAEIRLRAEEVAQRATIDAASQIMQSLRERLNAQISVVDLRKRLVDLVAQIGQIEVTGAVSLIGQFLGYVESDYQQRQAYGGLRIEETKVSRAARSDYAKLAVAIMEQFLGIRQQTLDAKTNVATTRSEMAKSEGEQGAIIFKFVEAMAKLTGNQDVARIQAMQNAAALQEAAAKTTILAMDDAKKIELEAAVKDARWDLELIRDGNVALGAIVGASSMAPGASPFERALGAVGSLGSLVIQGIGLAVT